VMDYHSRILTEEGYEIRLIFGKGGGLEYKSLEEYEVSLLSPEKRIQKTKRRDKARAEEALFGP